MWRASSLILGTKKEDLPESQFTCVESQFAYPGDKEGGPAGEPVRLCGEPIRLSWGQRRRPAGEPVRSCGEPIRLSWGQRRRTCRRASSLVWRANSLILGTKKEDLPESQFACVESQFASCGDKEGGPAGEPVRLCGEPVRLSCGDKEGGPAGEPVRLCEEPIRLSRGQRRRTCQRASSLVWRANSLLAGPKKEDLPESQFACVESQFAYSGDKEGGPAGEPVRLCGEPIRLSWGQRRRTCGRASSLVVESQFAYPGDKEGGPAGEPVRSCGEPIRLSWGQRRRTCRRASSLVRRANSLILGTKKEDLPESQFACVKSQFAYPGTKKEDLPESQFVCVESQFPYPGDKEGAPAGEPVRLCGEPIFTYPGDKEGGPAGEPVRLFAEPTARCSMCFCAARAVLPINGVLQLCKRQELLYITGPVTDLCGQNEQLPSCCWSAPVGTALHVKEVAACAHSQHLQACKHSHVLNSGGKPKLRVRAGL